MEQLDTITRLQAQHLHMARCTGRQQQLHVRDQRQRTMETRPWLDAAKGEAGNVLRTFDLVYQLQQRCQLAVAATGVADVFDEARRIGQVLLLAVAQRQARKNAGHFRWRCRPIHSTAR